MIRDQSRSVIDVSSVNLQERDRKRVATGVTLGDMPENNDQLS